MRKYRTSGILALTVVVVVSPALRTEEMDKPRSEIMSFAGANWKGDASTVGGLDGLTEIGDTDTLVCSADSFAYPGKAEVAITLKADFSELDSVEIAIGYRANGQQTPRGEVYWDGKLLAAVNAQRRGDRSRVKRVRVSPRDFGFTPGRHVVSIVAGNSPNAYDFFELDAMAISTPGALFSSADFSPDLIQLKNPILVTGASLSREERIAIQRLRERARLLFGKDLLTKPAGRLTRQDRSARDLIIVGTESGNPLLAEVVKNEHLFNRLVNARGFQREEGYVLAALMDYPSSEHNTVVAGSLGNMGAVYAAASLDAALCRKHSIGRSTPSISLSFRKSGGKLRTSTEIPALQLRSIYLNIGGRLDGLTVHNWGKEQWRRFVDDMVVARINRIDFNLWMDTYSIFSKSDLPKERSDFNLRLHENLREMIDYAHERGLKVCWYLTPTLVPSDIWKANPDIRAKIVYAERGFSVVCPSNPKAWALMRDVYAEEIEYFKNSDAFQIWFYDPGGCMCEKCRPNQAEALMRQVDAFWEMIRSPNPRAKLEISLWPICAIEHEYGCKFGQNLLDRLKERFADDLDRITLTDDMTNPASYIHSAGKLGLRCSGFLYRTGTEDGFVLLEPMIDYIGAFARRVKGEGFKGMSAHQLIPVPKYPSVFFAGHFAWNPRAARNEVIERYAKWQTGDIEAAQNYALTLLLLDRYCNETLSREGAEAILAATEKMWNRLPPAKAQEMEWQLTSAKLIKVLAEIIQTKKGSPQREKLIEETTNLLSESDSFRQYAPLFRSSLPDYFLRFRD